MFLKNIAIAYPSTETSANILKIDGAKGAWAAVSTITKRTGFRDHRHRSENAATKFGSKGKNAYLKIAKIRDSVDRDALIEKQSPEFKKWLFLVDFKH